MRLKLILRVILAALIMTAAFPVFSQTVPAATQDKLPLSVGGGITSFDPDYQHGRMLGEAAWVNYTPHWVPRILDGIGLEAEIRDLSFHRSPSQPSNLREDVGEGGLTYTWRHFHNIRPYAKFFVGYGNTDYGTMTTPVRRFHDSRTITSMGGGAEFRAYRNLWVRGDYEYQRWPDFFMITTPAGLLNPQGFTVGASYHLGSQRLRLFRK